MKWAALVLLVTLAFSASAAARNIEDVRQAVLAKRIRARPVDNARREFAQMGPQQRRVRAENVYRRTWRKVAPLYGRSSSEPAPPLAFQKGLGPEVYGEVSPENTVTLAPSMIRRLAKRPVKNHLGGLTYGNRALGQEKLMHEWAHIYQDPTLQEDPNENHREEAAELFASYYGHKMFGSRPMLNRTGEIPYENRKQGSRDLAATYGKGYWRKRQFIGF